MGGSRLLGGSGSRGEHYFAGVATFPHVTAAAFRLPRLSPTHPAPASPRGQLRHVVRPKRHYLVLEAAHSRAASPAADEAGSESLHRRTVAPVGLSAATIRKVVTNGLDSEVMEDAGCYSMVVSAFIFQCRTISVAHVSVGDITVAPGFVKVTLTHRKRRSP